MTVCRYYLQGTCRFGDRCRYEHVNYSSEYSNRSDHGYQDRRSRQNDSHVSYNTQRDDSYTRHKQQNYTYSERYSTEPAYSGKQYREDQFYRHESGSNVWSRDAEYGRVPSSNYYPNKHENTSGVYKQHLEHNIPKSSFSTQNTSTPKSKVPFSFKDPSIISKQDSSDLKMNQANMVYAEIMKNDAIEWEQSNIWPFSSYGPIPASHSFPGFYDISPEELKYEAYKAEQNNTFNSYVQFVEKIMLEFKKKREGLKEPSISLISRIDDFRNGKTSSVDCTDDGGNIFSKFTSNADQTEMFAEESQVSQPTTASNFSFKTTLDTVPNASTVTASNFSFKTAVDTVPKASTVTASNFSFKAALDTDSVPNASTVTASNFSFKTTLDAGSVPQASTSPFSFKVPTSELYSKQTVAHGDIYTPVEELSLQDKEQFSQSTFSLGKIPTVPPPKSMC